MKKFLTIFRMRIKALLLKTSSSVESCKMVRVRSKKSAKSMYSTGAKYAIEIKLNKNLSEAEAAEFANKFEKGYYAKNELIVEPIFFIYNKRADKWRRIIFSR